MTLLDFKGVRAIISEAAATKIQKIGDSIIPMFLSIGLPLF